jgi:hypothetical protein
MECSYEMYHKELMSIVRAFEELGANSDGAANPTQVLLDHKNLEYFMTNKILHRRLV